MNFIIVIPARYNSERFPGKPLAKINNKAMIEYVWKICVSVTFSKNIIVLIGAILFCIPLLNYRYYKELKFKLFYLSSLLIWVVVFNHKAESPTYIIAITGVAIWFFSQDRKIENTVLLVLAFIFTVLSPTDFFPRTLRDAYVGPYVLKAVPCILIWVKISYDLIMYRSIIKSPFFPEHEKFMKQTLAS